MSPRYSTISGDWTKDANRFAVDDPEIFAEGDIVYVPRTGERIGVRAVEHRILRTMRAVASWPVDLRDGDEVLIVGHAVDVR